MVILCPQLWESLRGILLLACLSVHPLQNLLQNLLRYSFEISYIDFSSKNNWHVFFFKVWIIPLFGVMPLLEGHNEFF